MIVVSCCSFIVFVPLADYDGKAADGKQRERQARQFISKELKIETILPIAIRGSPQLIQIA